MNEHDFLVYSCKDSMDVLRKRFNQGESIYCAHPEQVSISEALVDLEYTKFVFEQAYSGYTYFDKDRFDSAFDNISKHLQENTSNDSISVNALIDVFADNLSFIKDGHLSFTTSEHGKGFYKKLQTYVSELILAEFEGKLFEVSTKKPVCLKNDHRLFPTVHNNKPAFLIGIRSTSPIDSIEIDIDGEIKEIPLHKIKSCQSSDDVIVRAEFEDGIAYVESSTFVGDSQSDLDKIYETGKACRDYDNVIWDMSNNLGGNSDFAKQFLKGLNGKVSSSDRVLSLNSSLVYAKEYGNISDVPYHFEDISADTQEDDDLYNGTLHVIINDRVASSAESAIAMAKNLKNVVFYGCNSLGIGRFGDLCIYYLPNSGITLWLPQKVFETEIEECEGFEPDVWVDSDDVKSYVKELIVNRG